MSLVTLALARPEVEVAGHTTAVMTQTVPDLGSYWRKELASLRAFRTGAPGATYRDWQPTKWQSLRRLLDSAVAYCAAAGAPLRSAVELGCGSATLSIKLAGRGVSATGVDRVPEALKLARACCDGMALPVSPKFVVGDFLTERLADTVARADIVVSGGVVEHWDVDGQLRALQAHLDLSQRWVLVTVPNLDSPVFQSFLRWAESTGRLYEDEHHDISVPALAKELGCEVAVADGCRLFLPRAEHYAASDSELDEFNAELRSRLMAAGGQRYAAFPEMNFTAADIDVLHSVEEAATTEERMRFGFLHYYLLDARPSE
jgi:SAM-dependent methyltransferase